MRSASEVVFAKCSDQPCWLFVLNCDVKLATERVKILRKEFNNNQSTHSKTNKLLEILRHRLKRKKRKSGQHAWMVDISLFGETDLKLICSKCFCNLHGISPRTFNTLVKEAKDDQIVHTQESIRMPNMYTAHCRDRIVDLMRTSGQVAAVNEELVAAIPDTVAALQATAWFHNYYTVVGDCHTDGTYTLEVPSIKWLHDTYTSQCEDLTEVVLLIVAC